MRVKFSRYGLPPASTWSYLACSRCQLDSLMHGPQPRRLVVLQHPGGSWRILAESYNGPSLHASLRTATHSQLLTPITRPDLQLRCRNSCNISHILALLYIFNHYRAPVITSPRCIQNFTGYITFPKKSRYHKSLDFNLFSKF